MKAPPKHLPLPGKFEAPGALALASIFMVLFVILYGWSWFELSQVRWIIG